VDISKSKFTVEQRIGLLKQAEAGMAVAQICREGGCSDARSYKWRAKFGGRDVSQTQEGQAAGDGAHAAEQRPRPRRGVAHGRRQRQLGRKTLRRIRPIFQLLLHNWIMQKNTAISVFESLASGLRLDVYRLLVRKGREGMVAGEIASALEVPPTNLSFHLKALTQAGLLTVEQEGRFQRYRANLPLMLDLIAYLTEECCAGQPEQCADLRAASRCADAVLPPLSSTQETPKK
jgi:DNA-binding transcriptional ArsR family regulator